MPSHVLSPSRASTLISAPASALISAVVSVLGAAGCGSGATGLLGVVGQLAESSFRLRRQYHDFLR